MDRWWVHQVLSNPDFGAPYLASWIVWVVVSITLHELAHGWTAIRQGDRTPILTGHMTWNPVVHMGAHSLIMFAVVGLAWGSMPVDPTRFRSRYGDFLVSMAGPLMNVVIALVCTVLGGLWFGYGMGLSPHADFYENVVNFFSLGVSLNVVLVMLNLLPIPPLDGSRMLANVSRSYRGWISHPQADIGGLMALLAIFYFGGRYLWLVGHEAAALGIAFVAAVTGGAGPPG